MALSHNFFPDATDIVDAALRRIRAADPEDTTTITTAMRTNAYETLNFMLAAWQADGLQLWCRKTLTATTLTSSQGSYTIGASGADITLSRPLLIYQAWLRNTSDSVDTPLTMISEDEYYKLNKKTSEGHPVLYYYDPAYDGSSNQGTNAKGTLYIWPEPDSTTATNKKIMFRYQRPFLNFNAGTDELDMPQEWYEAVKLGLAYRIAPEYGVPMLEYDRLKKEAMEAKELALGWDAEKSSLFITPDYT